MCHVRNVLGDRPSGMYQTVARCPLDVAFYQETRQLCRQEQSAKPPSRTQRTRTRTPPSHAMSGSAKDVLLLAVEALRQLSATQQSTHGSFPSEETIRQPVKPNVRGQGRLLRPNTGGATNPLMKPRGGAGTHISRGLHSSDFVLVR